MDFSSKKIIINNYHQKNINERAIKQNIILSNYKRFKNKNKNINAFIKSSFNDKKDNSSSLFSYSSPKDPNKKNINNNILNNNISYTKFDLKQQNNIFLSDMNKTNKIIQLGKYNFFAKKEKKSNNKKEIDKDKLNSLMSPKLNKSEIFKKNLTDKKIKNKKEENLLIKTTISFDEIRQTIKKLIGNNVVENYEEKNLKFICKTKIGKDDLMFYLELIGMNYGTRIFKGTLIQGETKLYKELLLKLKEKLN